MKKFFAIVAMLLLAAAMFGSVFGFKFHQFGQMAEQMAARPEPRFPVEVVEVEARDWQPSIASIGLIEPRQGVVVASSVSGSISEIHFRSGQSVSKGQLLVSLESEVERANLASARARLPSVKRQLERHQQLLERGSVSQTQFDDSQAAYLALEADIAALRATIARREIRAPFAGIIGLRQVNLGEFIQAGQQIAHLEDLSHMLLRFSVAQTQLPRIEIGGEVQLSSDVYPERKFLGTITAIEPIVEARSGVVELQAEIPNAEGLLRSGMYSDVRVLLPLLSEQVVIPQQAISFNIYGQSVFVIAPDEAGEPRAQRRDIKVAMRQGDWALVEQGLEIGEQVVRSGQVRLRNGTLVELVEDSFVQRPATLPKS